MTVLSFGWGRALRGISTEADNDDPLPERVSYDDLATKVLLAHDERERARQALATADAKVAMVEQRMLKALEALNMDIAKDQP